MKVAVVGGGITGAVAVSHLARTLPAGSAVVCFDQGRAIGGRTSSRRIRTRDFERVAAEGDAEETHGWDHGCQFFRADTDEFRNSILPEWLEKQYAVEWKGRFGIVAGRSDTSEVPPDFFGLPSHAPVYHGVGGMYSIATGLLRGATSLRQDVEVQVKVGARVASIVKCEDGDNAGKWQLFGTTGEAAFHDSKEEVASQAEYVPCSPLFFDALLVTDGIVLQREGSPCLSSHVLCALC